mgnify:CR=1 FL=1
MRFLWYFMLAAVVAALLIACEQQPGEITGRTSRSDGSPTSVRIQVVDARGNIAWEGSSEFSSGTWYTGSVLKPGTYTVYYFTATHEPYEGKEQEVTVNPGASVVLNQTF